MQLGRQLAEAAAATKRNWNSNWKQQRGETLNTNSIRIFYALRKCKGSRGRGRQQWQRQRQAAYASKAQNKQHKLFRQATEPRQRERGRQEERWRRVQSSVAVSILAARRQSELEMSSQIGAARAAFMLHLCSPRNTLECKAKPDRGGQREKEREGGVRARRKLRSWSRNWRSCITSLSWKCNKSA